MYVADRAKKEAKKKADEERKEHENAVKGVGGDAPVGGALGSNPALLNAMKQGMPGMGMPGMGMPGMGMPGMPGMGMAGGMMGIVPGMGTVIKVFHFALG